MTDEPTTSNGHSEAIPEPVIQETDCILCVTILMWLRESWPQDKLEELPEFLAREHKPIVKVHNEAADFLPLCETCSRFFLGAMGQFHRERQARLGEDPTPLRARVGQHLVKPGLVLPGDPEFRVSS